MEPVRSSLGPDGSAVMSDATLCRPEMPVWHSDGRLGRIASEHVPEQPTHPLGKVPRAHAEKLYRSPVIQNGRTNEWDTVDYRRHMQWRSPKPTLVRVSMVPTPPLPHSVCSTRLVCPLYMLTYLLARWYAQAYG